MPSPSVGLCHQPDPLPDLFYDNPKGVVNRVFTLLILSFVGWNAGELIMITSDLHSSPWWGSRSYLSASFFSPSSSSIFPMSFPRINPLLGRLAQPHSVCGAGGPSGPLRPSPSGGHRAGGANRFHLLLCLHFPRAPGVPAAGLILGLIGWVLQLGVVNFVISYRQTKIARQRLQILYLLVGIISCSSSGFSST